MDKLCSAEQERVALVFLNLLQEQTGQTSCQARDHIFSSQSPDGRHCGSWLIMSVCLVCNPCPSSSLIPVLNRQYDAKNLLEEFYKSYIKEEIFGIFSCFYNDRPPIQHCMLIYIPSIYRFFQLVGVQWTTVESPLIVFSLQIGTYTQKFTRYSIVASQFSEGHEYTMHTQKTLKCDSALWVSACDTG